MNFLSRLLQPSRLTKKRQWSPLLNQWTALLLCLLILVGAEMVLPAFSGGAAGTSQFNCTKLQEQVNSNPSSELPILRQQLKTNDQSVESIDYVGVDTTDLFAVPPGSPIIVRNPPYPYQYSTQACWGDQNQGDAILTVTSGPDIGQSTILMPQPPVGKKSHFWDGIVWNRTRDLAVEAEPPTPEVTTGGAPFGPGQIITIILKNLPTSPVTTNNSQGGSNLPIPAFNWALDPGLEQDMLNPLNEGRSATLKLPTKDENLAKVGITISYDNKIVGFVSFDKGAGPDGKWTHTVQPGESRFFRRASLPVSSRWISRFWAISATLVAYLGISGSVILFNKQTGNTQTGPSKQRGRKDWKRLFTYLNPIVLTAGPYGKASLARLQLLWFTIVVLSVLVYLLTLTGDLSDLPASVLALLGISAAGTVGTVGVDSARKRLSFVNWQWLNEQGWLTEADQYGGDKDKTKQVENYGTRTHWRDLLLDEGGVLNVYKFQLFFTSLLVGVFLILSGGSNLRGFRLPENFPQLLGVSNLFYVFGRSVQPTGYDELDSKITSLIGKEKLLKTSVSAPNDPSQRPELLDDYLLEARSAAGMTKVLFSDLAKTKFDDEPITDMSLLPPWAQIYEKGWLSLPTPAPPTPAPPPPVDPA
jgi:hypothetical protein